MIGAFGGVGSTAALGLAAIARGLMPPTGMTTASPRFDALDLDQPAEFVVGGHDIRAGSFVRTLGELHSGSHIFATELIEACSPDLEKWARHVRPGTVLQTGSTISAMADLPETLRIRSPREAIERIQNDLRSFREQQKLDQVVVLNVASTEPPFEPGADDAHLNRLDGALDRGSPPALPASGIYAYAAIDLGLPYVNFTPSLGTSLPALEELASHRKAPIGGKDGKTGETLVKSVLAPMFTARNLSVLSWVGHNILGGRDGQVLNDPRNKESKIKSKDAALQQILGNKPHTHVSIEYVQSLDDWKTAWDHIHFEGFLGVKMALQFTWQGCDSILAAPLVLDLARLALLAQRRGESGVMRHLACFFKSPMGVEEHDFFRQFALLEDYVRLATDQRG